MSANEVLSLSLIDVYNRHILEIQRIQDNYQLAISQLKAKSEDQVKKISLELIEIVDKDIRLKGNGEKNKTIFL